MRAANNAMLEEFVIFHAGGMVLWSERFDSRISKGANPLNMLIGNVLLESRGGEERYEHESHMMKWVRDTQLGLVFACVWQKALQLMYIDDLLDKVKKKFIAAFKDRLQPDSLDLAGEFDFNITNMLRQCEEAAINSDKSKVPREFKDSKKWPKTRAGQNQIMHRIKAETRQGKGKKSQDRDSGNGDDIEDGEGTDGESPEQARDSEKTLTEE